MLCVSRKSWGLTLLAFALANPAFSTDGEAKSRWRDSSAAQAVHASQKSKNKRPSIGGTPPAEARVDEFYEFQPTASDPEGQPLSFFVRNKPAWASFDTSNGYFSGFPRTEDVGTAKRKIVITASDGKRKARLKPFRIEVLPVADPVEPPSGPVAPEGYSLYFNDEFNNESGAPDPNFWDYDVSYVRNNELQCYTDDRRENVRVENRNLPGESGGYLVLEARKEIWSCPQDATRSYEYTSGAITTRVRRNVDYLVGRTLENQPEKGLPFGIYEIRVKIPSGRGTWPAVWLLGHKKWSPESPTSLGWPDAGEVDIMEAVGFEEANGLNRVHSVLHRNKTFSWPNQAGRTGQEMYHDLSEPPSANFHVWKMIWTPDSIEVFVDGIRVRKMPVRNENGESVVEERDGFFRHDPDMDADTALGWPFSGELGNEFKLVLNLAYGGGYGGQQGIDDTIFANGSVEMLVDYVRVYTKD